MFLDAGDGIWTHEPLRDEVSQLSWFLSFMYLYLTPLTRLGNSRIIEFSENHIYINKLHKAIIIKTKN